MISLTLFKVNFDELNIKNISKRALLDSIKIFYKGDEFEYINFLEKLGIDYYQTFNNIFEFNNEINKEIKILNDLASKENIDKFDFKVVNLLRRNLKEINDNEYIKLNFDLRKLNDNSQLDKIKDIFLTTDSVSLVDFKEIEDERFSLIYHKKGAMDYNNEFLLNNSRETIQFLENFKMAKDNNFILTRFLLEIARKFKEAGINESFSYTYQMGEVKKEVIKDINEIIFWGNLSKEEKEQQKELEKQEQEISNKATQLAKEEIKKEKQQTRDSLAKDSTNEILESEKVIPRLYNLRNQNENDEKEKNNKNINSKKSENEEIKINIEKVIQESFEIYHQKELEKVNLRLERAKKDSLEAYNDLKETLNNGSSIIDGIKFIQQKYRNEDTINFATLLFSKDILGVKAKDDEIKNLKNETDEYKNYIETLNDEISKREETISKLRGTIQVKNNEAVALKLEYEKELEILKESDLKLKELEQTFSEQKLTIEELDKENAELSQNFKKLNDDKIRLEVKLEDTENLLKETKNKEDILKNEIKSLEQSKMENYKLNFEVENYKNKEQEYLKQIELLQTESKNNIKKDFELMKLNEENKSLKEQLGEYKNKISYYENQLQSIINQAEPVENKNEKQENSTEIRKPKRSKDILGDV